jgi:hypothetical protein
MGNGANSVADTPSPRSSPTGRSGASDDERHAWIGGLADGVVLVVDTHLDFHVAVVLDRLGRRLGEVMVPTTGKGYGKLVR